MTSCNETRGGLDPGRKTVSGWVHVAGVAGVVVVLSGALLTLLAWGQIQSERSFGCDNILERARVSIEQMAAAVREFESSAVAEIETAVSHGAASAGRHAARGAEEYALTMEKLRECKGNLADRGVASRAELDDLDARWAALRVGSSFAVRPEGEDFIDLGNWGYSCRDLDDFLAALREGVLEAVAGAEAARRGDLEAAAVAAERWGRALAGAESGVVGMRECAEMFSVDVDGLEAQLRFEREALQGAVAALGALRQDTAGGAQPSREPR